MTGSESPIYCVDQCRIRLAHDEYRSALFCLNQAIEIDPGFLRAYIKRVETLEKLLDQYAMMNELENIIAIYPDSPEAFYTRGRLASTITSELSPFEYYSLAIEADGNFSEAYLQRGKHQFINGNYLEALVDLTRCLKLDPYAVDAFLERAKAYWAIDRSNDAFKDLAAYGVRKQGLEYPMEVLLSPYSFVPIR